MEKLSHTRGDAIRFAIALLTVPVSVVASVYLVKGLTEWLDIPASVRYPAVALVTALWTLVTVLWIRLVVPPKKSEE